MMHLDMALFTYEPTAAHIVLVHYLVVTSNAKLLYGIPFIHLPNTIYPSFLLYVLSRLSARALLLAPASS